MSRSGFWLGVLLASDDMRAAKRRRQARDAARRRRDNDSDGAPWADIVIAVAVLVVLLWLGHLGGAR